MFGLRTRQRRKPLGYDILIDQAWIDAFGPPPYVLTQANKVYRLAVDVTAPRTAFVIGAAGVTLDLNGRVVTYGTAAPLALQNPSFEEGSGTTVPGWDLTGAPTAAIASSAGLYLSGSQVLHLTNFTTTQTVISSPAAIPVANRTYAVSIVVAHATYYTTTVKLSVIDSVTDDVLGTITTDNANNGYCPVVHFTPTTTNAVRLKIELTPPAASTESMDLDAAYLEASYDFGVLATPSWSGGLRGYANLSAAAQAAYASASNFTLKNGTLVQGQGHGYGGSAMFFQYINRVTVNNVTTLIYGADASSFDADNSAGEITVTNCNFEEEITFVSNRQLNTATIKLNHTAGPILVDNNNILGSPQIGIALSYNGEVYGVTISNNTISQNTVVANGYGIEIAALKNFEVFNNTITPTNGRGITIDGWSATAIENGNIHDNYVDVQEAPDREYFEVSSRALRVRNVVDSQGPQSNINIYDNIFIARSGIGKATMAFGCRIGYANPGGSMDDATVRIYDNLFKAIVETTDEAYHAQALDVDHVAPNINLLINNNTFESNDVSLSLGGADGTITEDVVLESNVFLKSADGAVRTYTAVSAGYWIHESHNVQLIDNQMSGASFSIVWQGLGTKDVGYGWLLTVTVTHLGTPVVGASVTVRDVTDTIVATGTTNASGQVVDIRVVSILYEQLTSDHTSITTTNKWPFSVSAVSGALTGSNSTNLTSNTSLTVAVT